MKQNNHRKKLTEEQILFQKGEYEKAGDEMIVSKWAIQVGQRAIRLSEIMRTGKINIK